MEEQGLEQAFAQWQGEIREMHLPRWEELPELELYMDQVIALMEKYLRYFSGIDDKNRLITPSIINNYVKLGIIPPPQKKKYTREHIAYLVIICILKQTLPISAILEIIEAQKRRYALPELLDLFCGMYEGDLGRQIDYTREIVSREAARADAGDLSLKMAVYAHAGRFVVQKILSLAGERDDLPPEKKPAEKKSGEKKPAEKKSAENEKDPAAEKKKD